MTALRAYKATAYGVTAHFAAPSVDRAKIELAQHLVRWGYTASVREALIELRIVRAASHDNRLDDLPLLDRGSYA